MENDPLKMEPTEKAEETVVITRNELERLMTAVEYTRATISKNNTFDTTHPDWMRVHRGRAFQASSYLDRARELLVSKKV